MVNRRNKVLSVDTGVSLSFITQVVREQLPGVPFMLTDHGRPMGHSGKLKTFTTIAQTKVLTVSAKLAAGGKRARLDDSDPSEDICGKECSFVLFLATLKLRTMWMPWSDRGLGRAA